MELLTQNSKLKKTSKKFNIKVLNFGIPAYRSETGKITCPFAGDCVKYCYAQKGAYIWKNVSPAFEKRLAITKQNNFIELMQKELDRKKPNFVRIHDSGDYYSPKYLNKWIKIALNNPNINFYSYTNSIKFFLNIDLPNNFDVIFSDGGKEKELINKKIHRHSIVFENINELLKAGYIDASNYDLFATKWYNKTNKVGLIFH